MGFVSLFELLSRLTIHIDEELRSLAFSSLQLFAFDFPGRREDVVAIFIDFIIKQVVLIFYQRLQKTVISFILILVISFLCFQKSAVAYLLQT